MNQHAFGPPDETLLSNFAWRLSDIGRSERRLWCQLVI